MSDPRKKPEKDLDFTEISGQQSLRKQIDFKYNMQALKNWSNIFAKIIKKIKK